MRGPSRTLPPAQGAPVSSAPLGERRFLVRVVLADVEVSPDQPVPSGAAAGFPIHRHGDIATVPMAATLAVSAGSLRGLVVRLESDLQGRYGLRLQAASVSVANYAGTGEWTPITDFGPEDGSQGADHFSSRALDARRIFQQLPEEFSLRFHMRPIRTSAKVVATVPTLAKQRQQYYRQFGHSARGPRTAEAGDRGTMSGTFLSLSSTLAPAGIGIPQQAFGVETTGGDGVIERRIGLTVQNLAGLRRAIASALHISVPMAARLMFEDPELGAFAPIRTVAQLPEYCTIFVDTVSVELAPEPPSLPGSDDDEIVGGPAARVGHGAETAAANYFAKKRNQRQAAALSGGAVSYGRPLDPPIITVPAADALRQMKAADALRDPPQSATNPNAAAAVVYGNTLPEEKGDGIPTPATPSDIRADTLVESPRGGGKSTFGAHRSQIGEYADDEAADLSPPAGNYSAPAAEGGNPTAVPQEDHCATHLPMYQASRLVDDVDRCRASQLPLSSRKLRAALGQPGEAGEEEKGAPDRLERYRTEACIGRQLFDVPKSPESPNLVPGLPAALPKAIAQGIAPSSSKRPNFTFRIPSRMQTPAATIDDAVPALQKRALRLAAADMTPSVPSQRGGVQSTPIPTVGRSARNISTASGQPDASMPRGFIVPSASKAPSAISFSRSRLQQHVHVDASGGGSMSDAVLAKHGIDMVPVAAVPVAQHPSDGLEMKASPSVSAGTTPPDDSVIPAPRHSSVDLCSRGDPTAGGDERSAGWRADRAQFLHHASPDTPDPQPPGASQPGHVHDPSGANTVDAWRPAGLLESGRLGDGFTRRTKRGPSIPAHSRPEEQTVSIPSRADVGPWTISSGLSSSLRNALVPSFDPAAALRHRQVRGQHIDGAVVDRAAIGGAETSAVVCDDEPYRVATAATDPSMFADMIALADQNGERRLNLDFASRATQDGLGRLVPYQRHCVQTPAVGHHQSLVRGSECAFGAGREMSQGAEASLNTGSTVAVSPGGADTSNAVLLADGPSVDSRLQCTLSPECERKALIKAATAVVLADRRRDLFDATTLVAITTDVAAAFRDASRERHSGFPVRFPLSAAEHKALVTLAKDRAAFEAERQRAVKSNDAQEIARFRRIAGEGTASKGYKMPGTGFSNAGEMDTAADAMGGEHWATSDYFGDDEPYGWSSQQRTAGQNSVTNTISPRNGARNSGTPARRNRSPSNRSGYRGAQKAGRSGNGSRRVKTPLGPDGLAVADARVSDGRASLFQYMADREAGQRTDLFSRSALGLDADQRLKELWDTGVVIAPPVVSRKGGTISISATSTVDCLSTSSATAVLSTALAPDGSAWQQRLAVQWRLFRGHVGRSLIGMDGKALVDVGLRAALSLGHVKLAVISHAVPVTLQLSIVVWNKGNVAAPTGLVQPGEELTAAVVVMDIETGERALGTRSFRVPLSPDAESIPLVDLPASADSLRADKQRRSESTLAGQVRNEQVAGSISHGDLPTDEGAASVVLSDDLSPSLSRAVSAAGAVGRSGGEETPGTTVSRRKSRKPARATESSADGAQAVRRKAAPGGKKKRSSDPKPSGGASPMLSPVTEREV